MEIFNTKKFREQFNKLDTSSLDTLDQAYAIQEDIGSLSHDLKLYSITLLENYCNNILLKSDFFNNKYPYSTIRLSNFHDIKIQYFGHSYENPICTIDMKEKMFIIHYFDINRIFTPIYISSFKNKADKLRSNSSFLLDKIINPSEKEIKNNMLKESFGLIKKGKIKEAINSFSYGLNIEDEKIKKVQELKRNEIKNFKEQINDYDKKFLYLSNSNLVERYKNYIDSFIYDLKKFLLENNFKEIKESKEIQSSNYYFWKQFVLDNFLLFINVFCDNDEESIKYINKNRFILDSNFNKINNL